MPQFAGGCLELFASEKNGRQAKPILVQETLSWEDHILSWFLEEMENRGGNFRRNWELRACRPKQTAWAFLLKTNNGMTTNLTVSLLWWQLWTGNSKEKRYTGCSIKNDDSIPRRKFWMVKSDNYVWRALESVLQSHADNFFPCILLKGNHDSSRSILNWKYQNWKNQESKFRNDMLVQINYKLYTKWYDRIIHI